MSSFLRPASSSHPGQGALLWLNIWSSRPAISLLRLSPFFLPQRRRRQRQQREEETKEEAEDAGIRCATSGWERDRHPGRMSQRVDSAIAASPSSDPPLTAETIQHFAAVIGLSLFRPPLVLLPYSLTIVSTEVGGTRGGPTLCGPSGGPILRFFRVIVKRESQARP